MRNSPFIDFNTYHSPWGFTHHKKRGHQLATEAEDLGLTASNTARVTFLKPPDITSAIHVTFHSPELTITWRAEYDTQRSDYYSLHISFGGVDCTNTVQKTLICWDKLHAALLLQTGTSLMPSFVRYKGLPRRCECLTSEFTNLTFVVAATLLGKVR